MNKNRILTIAALTIMAAFVSCNNDNEPSVTPDPKQPFTISATLGSTNTRATVEYGNTDISKGELFSWNEDDNFSVLIENGGKAELHTFTFNSFAVPGQPSGSATFTCSSIVGLKAENAFAIYPATDTEPTNNSFTFTCATTRTQTGTTLANFGKDMPMYAYTTSLATDGKLSFNHLSALLRFSITNIGPSDCTVKGIKVEANNMVFGTSGSIKYYNSIGDKPTITYNLDGSKATAITTDATLAKGETIDLYTTILPCVSLKGTQNATLTFTLTTIRNGKDDTQTFELDGSNINTGDRATWEAGKRYRFKINSGYKELTVGSPTIADWSDGTDLTGGEATLE